jgi:hypothetical protein
VPLLLQSSNRAQRISRFGVSARHPDPAIIALLLCAEIRRLDWPAANPPDPLPGPNPDWSLCATMGRTRGFRRTAGVKQL